jgi:hypothetical protein
VTGSTAPRRITLLGLALVLTIFGAGLVVQGVFSSALGAGDNPGVWEVPPEPRRIDNPAASDVCGPGLIYLPEIGKCTHGPDPAPTGFDVDERVRPLGAHAVSAQVASLPCDGDGQSGYRVQVLYVRGAQAASRYAGLVPSIRAWAAEANEIFRNSAAATGGTRQLRYVHHATCEPVVVEVPVSAGALAGFGAMMSELQAAGYNREDRIYLAFVDTTGAGICGIGTVSNDDRPSEAHNWNNLGPSFARVDAGCWSGRVAAHELMHNLGGVQLSAPNTSNGFHCTDEYDVMCYRDGATSPPMRTVCASSTFERLLDCGHDDYFHTAPPAGSYLATHWNAANNRFLIRGPGAPRPPRHAGTDVQRPRVTVVMPNATKRGKRLIINARAADNAGVASVAFGVCRGKHCTWDRARKLGVDRVRPYRVSWKAPQRGTFTILARATDTSGNVKIVRKTVTFRPDKQRSKR